jgi:hypothetical protein
MRRTKKELAFDKLVAINSLIAAQNIMRGLREGSTHWLVLKHECDAIVKRYPSLA